jgi:hypothetical protein
MSVAQKLIDFPEDVPEKEVRKRHRASDPATSVKGAERAARKSAGTKALVMEFADATPRTANELALLVANAYRKNVESVRKRVMEMIHPDDGRLQETGVKTCSYTGCEARTFVLRGAKENES